MSVNQDAKEAGQVAGDPDRVLPSEDIQTTRVTEARRWVRTYSQLVSFKNRLLQAAQQKLGDVTEEAARQEAVNTDLVLLEAEHSRIRRRLEFWKRRYDKLSR